ncbi:sugar transferase [Amylibacter sp. SFDW26]|uniref:sugar transferase n=1 Tax=Amylibacter sp. SFDW26 TaxID=2652722 RepID=UPI00186A5D0D|nr:sugar transferase [Amylibacter sp. SFDW26]
MDIIISVAILLCLLPFFLVIVIFIKIKSPGSAFFTQTRIGRDQVPFKLLKFRTMHIKQPDLKNATVTMRDDPRLYGGANFLRKYKIDELPQILNVLRGEMSLVGPRPTVREDYEKMTDEQRQRAKVKPGLTGLAQISGNTSLSWHERIKLDLKYIREASVWLNLQIMIKTAFLVLKGRAETHPSSEDEWS